MHTIIIPTDFSPAAKNAATYAIELAKQTGAKTLVVYHSFEVLLASDPLLGYGHAPIVNRYQQESSEELSAYKAELKLIAGDIEIETYHSPEVLHQGITELCEMKQADLVVMGTTGGGKLKEALIGSNTIKVARHINHPLIIVPLGAKFSKIEEVVFACDFKKVAETVPIAPIKKLLDQTKAKLFVLNINKENVHPSSSEKLMLNNLLQGYNPEYHFIHHEDFTEAINIFANEKKADLIITIPKKHGWFESLFIPSHTKQLAFHSHVPLMVVHD